MTNAPNQAAYLNADWTAPAIDAIPVTPSDTVNFAAGPCRFLYVGASGTVVLITANNNVATFVGVVAGTTLNVQARRVNTTSTTASSILALY